MDEGAELLVRLIFMVVFGAITAGIASSKGRNAVGWFFVGFLTGCIGLIIVLCLPNLHEEKARWDRSERERRRLREQLKQERMKTEAFQGHVHARLDAHDGALGMDTRSLTDGSQEPAPFQLEDSATENAPDSESFVNLEWFVAIEGRKTKALSFAQLKALYDSGKIGETNLVWATGMQEWKRILDVPGLVEALL